MGLFYFSGIENYLKKQELQKIKEQMSYPELDYKEFRISSPEIADFLQTVSFMGSRKVCVLWFFPEDAALVDTILSVRDSEIDIYLTSSELPDHRKKDLKRLLSCAKEQKFGKITEELLLKCIVSRLKRHGYEDKDIMPVMEDLKEVFQAYQLNPELELEEMQKHVDMIAFSGTLSRETIQAFAPKGAELRGFRLANMLLEQNKDCIVFAQQLMDQGESAIGILNLVLYQIRVCYKATLFLDGNKYLSLIGIRSYQIYPAFQKYSVTAYKRVYQRLNEGINRIKRGENDRAVLLESISEALRLLREGI